MLREVFGQRVVHASMCILPITLGEGHGIGGTVAPTRNLFIALGFLFSIRGVERSKKLVGVIIYILKSLEVNINFKV